jgi:tripartite-type tricarboxylate transporter receptor subunit TctC
MTSSFVRAAARGAFALALCATGVWAQGYPERPVRLIVSFTAGGTTDIVARLFAQQLAPLLNQPVVVENKPGAGGLIGTDFVAKAPPDGYTLLLANAGQTIAAAIRRKLPFEPVQDFAWISTRTTYPFVISTGMKSPLKSLADVIARTKAEPGKVSYGTSGVGVSGHFLGEWFSDVTVIDLLHVPFEGGAGAVMEVIAGRIDLQFEPVIGALPHVKEAKLRALAVTSRQPTSLLPDVPAAAQTVPGYVFQSWLGLAAPAATAPAIVARLNRELRRILGEPDVQKRLAEFGGVAAPSTPDEMRAQVTSEIDRWPQLVNNRHIEQQ